MKIAYWVKFPTTPPDLIWVADMQELLNYIQAEFNSSASLPEFIIKALT